MDNITITKIKEIFTVHSPKNRKETIENRNSYGLSFCKSGQITYCHNKEKVISDVSCAILLPKNKTYTLKGDKAGVFTVVNFDCTEELCDTVVAIPIEDNTSYINDFEKMKQLSLFEGNNAEIMSILYHTFHRLYQKNSNCKIIMPAINYIKNNYQNPELSNELLAKKCNISEVYFRKMFLKHFSLTPKQYILDIRISKAKQLLSEGILKINAVAFECGFSNQYHFCRIFKEKTGLTPTQYMKENKIYKI